MGYDRLCTHLTDEESYKRAASGESHVVRLKSPEKHPVVHDLIFGKVQDKWQDYRNKKVGDVAWDDPILLKSDGMPTYHLANVIDDHLMRITHVIRGSEWLSTTSRHIALYNAFGWEPPFFAHVGLLVDANGQKLSKRNSGVDTDIKSYRERGILPETLLNFVSLLGWSHKERSDFMDLEKMVEIFAPKFTKGNTIVSLDKLGFLQRRHAAAQVDRGGSRFEEMVDLAVRQVQSTFQPQSYEAIIDGRMPLRQYVANILRVGAKNYETPADFINHVHYFFEPRKLDGAMDLDERGRRCIIAATQLENIPADRWLCGVLNDRIRLIVQLLLDTSTTVLEVIPSFEQDFERKDWRKRFNLHLRVLVTGGSSGPGLSETMHLLGRDVVLARIADWADKIIRNGEQDEKETWRKLVPQQRLWQLEGLNEVTSEAASHSR
ncbi:MAG: Glutamate--tRNA ligase mitochondrial [Bathelium mastoideum]|nr:MAG: Glutamate--tRNA ligase mitochondrial [Bathelium mastoideum]